jgi:hypothetical protein
VKACCEREAKESESDFSKRLPTAFRIASECATVQFVVADENDKELEHNEYWRLRVDFHPRLERERFTLGLRKDKPIIAGDDAERNADFICKAAKNNGVLDIW